MTQFNTPEGLAITPSAPSRGSVTAVFSLIFGILSVVCCIVPVWGVIAGPLAIGLAVLVLRKGEQAAGRGLAIGGVATGLIGVIASVVVLAGVGLAMVQVRSFSNSVGTAVSLAQSGDSSKLISIVTPTSGTLTDADVKVFADKVQAKLGKFQQPYGGLLELIPVTIRFVQADPARTQRLSLKYSPIVYPAQFDNGRGAIVILVPQGASPTTGGPQIPVSNIGVCQEGSTDVIWLVLPEP